MDYDDHNPPHFHAEYNGNKIIVDIIKGKVIKAIKINSCMVNNTSRRVNAKLGITKGWKTFK